MAMDRSWGGSSRRQPKREEPKAPQQERQEEPISDMAEALERPGIDEVELDLDLGRKVVERARARRQQEKQEQDKQPKRTRRRRVRSPEIDLIADQNRKRGWVRQKRRAAREARADAKQDAVAQARQKRGIPPPKGQPTPFIRQLKRTVNKEQIEEIHAKARAADRDRMIIAQERQEAGRGLKVQPFRPQLLDQRVPKGRLIAADWTAPKDYQDLNQHLDARGYAQREIRTGGVLHMVISAPKDMERHDVRDSVFVEQSLTHMIRAGIDPDKHRWYLVRHHERDKQEHVHLMVTTTRHDGGVWHAPHTNLLAHLECAALDQDAGRDDHVFDVMGHKALGRLNHQNFHAQIAYADRSIRVPLLSQDRADIRIAYSTGRSEKYGIGGMMAKHYPRRNAEQAWAYATGL